jgi:tetratricopeptide (TPR) repeat protein
VNNSRPTIWFRPLGLWLAVWLAAASFGAATDHYTNGVAAYRNGEFTAAAQAFAAAAAAQPATGTYVNLGLAEWERGRLGHAVLAWERALWIDPDNVAAQENLRFAREQSQLEAPSLAWHEVASTWLPFNAWAWLAGVSLWLAVGMMTVPPWLRWRRSGWHQAVAAAGLAVFLMCVPAMLGLKSRQQLVIVLERNTPLRLTPTEDAQWVTVLSAGDPARVERARGNYMLVRTAQGRGWLERTQVGGISGGHF